MAGTLAAWPFWSILPVASLAVIYLVGVLAVAMRLGFDLFVRPSSIYSLTVLQGTGL